MVVSEGQKGLGGHGLAHVHRATVNRSNLSEKNFFKGTVNRSVCGNVCSSGLRLSIFNFSDPCGHYGRIYGFRDWFNRVVTVTNGAFGPIRDTIKSTVAVTVNSPFR